MLNKYFIKLLLGQDFFKRDKELNADKASRGLDTVFLRLSPFFPDESNFYDEGTIDLLTKRENLERESKQ